MSEKLLKAMMQLFAIIADIDELNNKSRIVVEHFLKQRLALDQVEIYLGHYDKYLETHHKVSTKKEGKRKKTSLNSVKVLKIYTQINGELELRQKIFVLLRLVKYINTDKTPTDQELEFVDTVSDVFNIPSEELSDIKKFVTCSETSVEDSEKLLIINSQEELASRTKNKHIKHDTLSGSLLILSVESVNMYALKFFGDDELLLNGQIIDPERVYILTQGSSIRSSKVSPIYYSDIISRFLSDKSVSSVNVIIIVFLLEYGATKKGKKLSISKWVPRWHAQNLNSLYFFAFAASCCSFNFRFWRKREFYYEFLCNEIRKTC